MNIKRWVLLAALVLFFSSVPGFAAEKSPVSIELHDLMGRIQFSIDQGKRTHAELAPHLQEFDTLFEKYSDQKTDDVAEILAIEARIYLQVLDDSAKARQLVLRLKNEFPNTTQGRKASDLLASISRHEEARRIGSFLVIGNRFPDFSEKDTLHHDLTLSGYRGRVVLLEFWATWSRASVDEVPQLVAVYNRFHTRGFEIVGISLDDDNLKLSGFTAQNRMRWPQYCDAAKWKNKLALKYGIDRLPANYLLDEEGKIIAKNLRGSELEDAVAAALAKK